MELAPPGASKFAPPVYSVKPTFTPIGAQAASEGSAGAQQMAANIDRSNEQQKAMMFQQHLQKGLSGMTEILNQLPPDVKATVPDPSAYADSDEKRTMWYMSVNQAVNKANMRQAAANGDTPAVEQMGLMDPKATQKDFTDASENASMDQFANNFNPTKQVSKTVFPVTGLKDALVSQESGGDYSAVGQIYKKQDGSQADPNTGEVALGKYQIVPKFWFDKIGLDPTNAEDRKKFLDTPELQDKAFDIVLQDSLQQFGGDMNKVVANYYGGPSAASVVGTPAGDKPQSAGMPSVNDYVKSVMGKFQATGGKANPDGQIVTEDKNKSADDVALEVFKQDPRILDKIEPLLKHLGKGDGDMKALQLLQRQAEEAGRNTRFAKANDTRNHIFDSKQQTDLYDDLQKAEIPTIGSTLKDIDKILTPQGGIKGVNAKMAGTGYLEKALPAFLKGENAVNMNSLLQRLYSLELKRISGVAVSDTEFQRYKTAFNSGVTFSPKEQMFALRSFVRAFRTQVKTAKGAYGDKVWNTVADAAGINLNDLPDVPDAVGNAPVDAKAPPAAASSKADAAKNKYGLSY